MQALAIAYKNNKDDIPPEDREVIEGFLLVHTWAITFWACDLKGEDEWKDLCKTQKLREIRINQPPQAIEDYWEELESQQPIVSDDRGFFRDVDTHRVLEVLWVQGGEILDERF